MASTPRCIPNIGPVQRRRRALAGIAAGLGGVAAAVVLVRADASTAARLVTFLPFWGAALGVLEAREKT